MDEKCIFVVDEDEDARNIISEILVKSGFEIIAARNDQEAFESLQRKHFDLLITDLVIAGVAGIDLFNKIRTIAPEIGVIIVTGYGSMDTYLELMTQGAFDYLAKPFRRKELVNAVTKFFSAHKSKRLNGSHQNKRSCDLESIR